MKKKRAPAPLVLRCLVCSAPAPEHLHFGGKYIHDTVHVAMSPVLRVERCRTRPGSIVVRHHHTGIHLRWVIVAFHLSLPFLLSFGIRTVPVIAFFHSLFYCLVCKSPRLKASLPCAVLTDSGSRFHLPTTLTANEYFIISVRAYWPPV
jgi:hypothetical protein